MAFTFVSPITVNASQVSGTQTDFPVLINLTDARFKSVGNGGHVQSASGFDIRPYMGATALTFELDRYTATSGEVIMWAKVPSISSTANTSLSLYYGDTTLTTNGSSTSTWGSNYVRVYHYGNGTVLSSTDSTGIQNGTFVNTPTASNSGKINGCGSFASASTQYMTSATYDAQQLCVEAWVNGTSFPSAYNAVFSRFVSSSDAFQLFVKSNGKLACFSNGTLSSTNYDGTGVATLSAGTFYHLCMTWDLTNGVITYVNGVFDGQGGGTVGPLFDNTNGAVRVASDSNTPSREWNGLLDEVRLSNIQRSQSWALTGYNNHNAPATFITLGTETSVGGGGTFGDTGTNNSMGTIHYFDPGGIVDANTGG